MRGTLTLMVAAVAALALAQQQTQPALQVAEHEEYGSYLTDGEGRALYLFVDESAPTQDPERMTEGIRTNAVSCMDACLEAWPAFTAEGDVQVGEGLDEELLYTAEFDGRMHVVYNGWPLFYFVRDEEPDAVEGQGRESFGGTWYLVDPEGMAVEDE